MAMAVPDFIVEDHQLELLKCSTCSDLMMPPIFKCDTGHSVCERCYHGNGKCSKCSEVYNKTLRNFELELLAEHVLYPCQFVGCSEAVGLAGWKKHKKNCMFRFRLGNDVGNDVVCCPYCNFGYSGSCNWRGPLSSLIDHGSDPSNRNHPVFSLYDALDDSGVPRGPMPVKFVVPDEVNGSGYFEKVFIYNGAVTSVIHLVLCMPTADFRPLELWVDHIVPQTVSQKLCYRVIMESPLNGSIARDGEFDCDVVYDANNSRSPEDWPELWCLEFLEKGGFVERDEYYENWKISLKIEILEKK